MWSHIKQLASQFTNCPVTTLQEKKKRLQNREFRTDLEPARRDEEVTTLQEEERRLQICKNIGGYKAGSSAMIWILRGETRRLQLYPCV